MSTAPIFAPDGTLGDIPAGQLAAAIKAGAKPGVNIVAPDGKKGVVPVDRYVDAVKAGAKVAPFEDQDIKHPGFWSALADDLKGVAAGVGETAKAGLGSLGGDPTASVPLLSKIAENVSEAPKAWAERKEAGYSLPYRLVAPVGSAIGVNASGMEQSAKEGDMAGVAGHAAAVPVVMAATKGLVKGAPAAVDALSESPVASIPVRLAARSAEAAANQKLVPVKPILSIMTPADEAEAAQFKVPGRDFGLPAKAAPPAASEPAPQPSGANIPKRATAEVWRDATRQNVPYAGEDYGKLQEATQAAIDKAIPAEGDTLALNKRVTAQVESHLSQGNVEAAENVLDTAAKKADPKYSPPSRPRIVPSVQNIRERIAQVSDAEAQPNRPTPDSMEDRALQQEMNQDLEKHGWAAESEARREFIARNSTGVTKSELTGAAEKPVKYTKTPALSSPGTGAADDLTDLLQKSLEAAKKVKGQH